MTLAGKLACRINAHGESVRQVYPQAFGVISIPDGPIDARHAELVAAVKCGDILMFRAWFDDPDNDKVRSIYKEAQAKKSARRKT